MILYLKMSLFRNIKKSNFFTIVPQNNVYFREFLGMNRKKLLPGISFYLPPFHILHKIDLRETGYIIKGINCYTGDNVPVIVGGSLFYKVFDAEKACFSVKDYHTCIISIGESSIRSVIGSLQYDEVIRERNQINKKLVETVGNSIKDWGIDTHRFEINEFKPQDESMKKQLELQLESERKRRANELETQAHIRTSEGHKMSIILESEGKLSEMKNKADAEKYLIDTKTKALKAQIKELSEEMNGNIELAVNFILESKRIEEFGKIKESHNKEIYFCDPKGIVPSQKVFGDMIDKENKKI